jgi:hypothetical protein
MIQSGPDGDGRPYRLPRPTPPGLIPGTDGGDLGTLS